MNSLYIEYTLRNNNVEKKGGKFHVLLDRHYIPNMPPNMFEAYFMAFTSGCGEASNWVK